MNGKSRYREKTYRHLRSAHRYDGAGRRPEVLKELPSDDLVGCVPIVMKSKTIDLANVATDEAKAYYAEHPGSPAAVRRPRLFIRGNLWIALLGPNTDEGVIGIGHTVEDALHAFDNQYLAGLRLPGQSSKTSRATSRRSASAAKPLRDFAC
jgi:hypothetical protein